MDYTKNFFKICAGISMVICSISLLIFSIEKATAKSAPIPERVHLVSVGAVTVGDKIIVVGYDPVGPHVGAIGTMDVKEALNPSGK